MSSSDLQNKAALEHFIKMPVDRNMIDYLARKAGEVIPCERPLPLPASAQSHNQQLPLTPPQTPPPTDQESAKLPSVEAFILSLVQQSHVQVNTLMCSLVYLDRLRSKLPPVAKGIPCTVHRIFLASLILAAKYLNDSSPKNKHWARYTTVPGFDNFSFSNSEINLMEKQMLFLLDWELSITQEDLYFHLEPFLAPIRLQARLHAEQKMHEMHRAREAVAAKPTQPPMALHRKPARPLYDSPRSVSNLSDRSGYRARGHYPSSSRSRLASRTPSLSPPSRSDASSPYASSISTSSPMSLLDGPSPIKHCEPVRIHHASQEMLPTVIDIPAVYHQPKTHDRTAAEEEKPAKRMRRSASSLFTRFLGSTGYGRQPLAAA